MTLRVCTSWFPHLSTKAWPNTSLSPLTVWFGAGYGVAGYVIRGTSGEKRRSPWRLKDDGARLKGRKRALGAWGSRLSVLNLSSCCDKTYTNRIRVDCWRTGA